MRLQGEVKLDEALWLLGSLCGLFRIPFDASHIALAPPATPVQAPLPPLRPLLIVKASTDQLLYFRPGQQTPETLPIADAATRLAPELLLVARDSTASGDEPDDIAGFTSEPKAFGFSWFIPELLKHKTLWRDVLLASLAIQIVGLSEFQCRLI